MGSLEARMKDGSFDSSEGLGGRQTKCRISAAEVPIYRLSSRGEATHVSFLQTCRARRTHSNTRHM